MLSRRALLLAATGVTTVAAGGAAMEADVLPGRVAAHRLLRLNGPPGAVPQVTAGPVTRGGFRSAARGTRVGYAVIRPPGSVGELPLVVALHGLGGDHTTGLRLGLPQFLAAAVAAGVPPFAIATVDGGTGYYHPHGGDDAGAMVTDELLPRLAAAGLGRDRIGLYGWSMGGYGALRLAAILGPERVVGVAAASAALWTDPADASRSGFADAAEYRRYSVMGRQADLAGIPVRLDVGDGDPFRDAVRHYAAGFPKQTVTLRVTRGGHDQGYWRRILPGELRLLGRRLAGL